MYVVDGYKMAEGIGTFRFKSMVTGEMKQVSVDAVFLYRPDTKLWYVAPCKDFPWGSTFPKDAMVQIEEKEGTTIYGH